MKSNSPEEVEERNGERRRLRTGGKTRDELYAEKNVKQGKCPKCKSKDCSVIETITTSGMIVKCNSCGHEWMED